MFWAVLRKDGVNDNGANKPTGATKWDSYPTSSQYDFLMFNDMSLGKPRFLLRKTLMISFILFSSK